MKRYGLPPKQGLYDPSLEHDACGIGFVANLKKPASHELIEQATEILCRLTHRGAAGSDEATGDGAGMLIQTPDKFLRKVADQAGFGLPAQGEYATALVFLAVDDDQRARQIEIIESVVAEEGQSFLGWREVPTDPEKIGQIARTGMPAISQFFVGAADGLDQPFRAQALRDPATHGKSDRRARRRLPYCKSFVQDLSLQGHVPRPSDARVLP